MFRLGYLICLYHATPFLVPGGSCFGTNQADKKKIQSEYQMLCYRKERRKGGSLGRDREIEENEGELQGVRKREKKR